MTTAYLGLGSNLGDRAAHLAAARSELVLRGVQVLRESTVIETEPFGVADQGSFLNQVVEVEWLGSARELLTVTQAVERAVGRTPTYRWGPREIDVDILLFGQAEIDEPGLTIPHPGIGEREFIRRSLDELHP